MLPVFGFVLVFGRHSLESRRSGLPPAGTIVLPPRPSESSHALDSIRSRDEGDERRPVLMTGRGPWVGAPAGRPYVSAPDIPDELKRALLYQEDQAFYTHGGYSPREVYIVLRDYLFYGHRLRGASTLSQQLARTVFLSSERSLRRKLLEFRLARALERRLSKERILELYLNHVYWGGESTGVVEAARAYYQRPPDPRRRVNPLSRLGTREFAFLVALLPNPNACAPARAAGDEHCKNRGIVRRMTRIIDHFEGGRQ
jgi:monofunctional biosynthetic peptidoglycan transglycosylase